MTQLSDMQLFEDEIFRRLRKAVNSNKARLIVSEMRSEVGPCGTISVKIDARLVHGESYFFNCTFHSSSSSWLLDSKWSSK